MTGDDRIARWKGENRDMDINEEMKIYMQTIGFLDESTNDYLYIYDMISDRIYFTDKICEKCGERPGYPFKRLGQHRLLQRSGAA